MANRLHHVMLHEQACQQFTDNILPMVRSASQQERDGFPDWTARSEAWSNWTDSLCQDGQISTWQCENWSHPRCCGD